MLCVTLLNCVDNIATGHFKNISMFKFLSDRITFLLSVSMNRKNNMRIYACIINIQKQYPTLSLKDFCHWHHEGIVL